MTLMNVVFRLVDGPTWAYYLFMLAGVPACYGFIASLGMAKESRKEETVDGGKTGG